MRIPVYGRPEYDTASSCVTDPRFVLPHPRDPVYLRQGSQFTIWKDNVQLREPSFCADLEITVTDGPGNIHQHRPVGLRNRPYEHCADRWTFAPTSATPLGDYEITISQGAFSKAFVIRVIDPTFPGSRLVSPIGDSAIGDNGLNRFFQVCRTLLGGAITGVGRKGSDPVKHEGLNSSYEYALTNVDSSFVYGGAFDPDQWLDDAGGVAPDLFDCSFTANDFNSHALLDSAGRAARIAEVLAFADTFIAGMTSLQSTPLFRVRLGWCGMIKPAGWESTYPGPPPLTRTAWRTMWHEWREAAHPHFSDRKAEGIFIAAGADLETDPYAFPDSEGHHGYENGNGTPGYHGAAGRRDANDYTGIFQEA